VGLFSLHSTRDALVYADHVDRVILSLDRDVQASDVPTSGAAADRVLMAQWSAMLDTWRPWYEARVGGCGSSMGLGDECDGDRMWIQVEAWHRSAAQFQRTFRDRGVAVASVSPPGIGTRLSEALPLLVAAAAIFGAYRVLYPTRGRRRG